MSQNYSGDRIKGESEPGGREIQVGNVGAPFSIVLGFNSCILAMRGGGGKIVTGGCIRTKAAKSSE